MRLESRLDCGALYKKITEDPRNSEHILLSRVPIHEPVFREWSMAFRRVTDLDRKNIEGYEEMIDSLSLPANTVDQSENIKKIMYSYLELL